MMSLVNGTNEQDVHHVEEVIHRPNEDPMVLAFRRNHELAGCVRVRVDTMRLFTIDRQDAEGRRSRSDIPFDDRKEEWDW
jgi:hypothetical protein